MSVSTDDLARQARTSPERIASLEALGLLTTTAAADGHHPTDVYRVRLIDAFERAGIATDDIAEATRQGRLSFDFLALVFDPSEEVPKSYRQLAAEQGIDVAALCDGYVHLGLPVPDPDDPIHQGDEDIAASAQMALALGLPDADVERAKRVFGEHLRRILETESSMVRDSVERQFREAGDTPAESMERLAQLSPYLRATMDAFLLSLYRRHQERARMAYLVQHFEEALAASGIEPHPVPPEAIAFLDLTGSTELAMSEGDEHAAEIAGRFGDLVHRTAGKGGGKVVKLLGDGVMCYFADPGAALECSLDVIEVMDAGLPPAHVGISAGPVVSREGDYFGRTVIMASRISSVAGPGEVIVDDAVATAAPPGLAIAPKGPVALKGMGEPVALFDVRRA